ncbi:MAG: ABC transporter permease [Bacillota bacterium]|jgi:hypothetical protein
MYLQLGFHNALANRGRTIMAACVMAAAALILTVSLSTSSGFIQSQELLLRYQMGGDIIIFPGKFVIAQNELAAMREPWEWKDHIAPWQNELPGFLLRLPYDGYMGTASQSKTIDLARVQEVAARHAEVSHVYPYYYLPAITAYPTAQGTIGMVTPLRGRDPVLDQSWNLAELFSRATQASGAPDGSEPDEPAEEQPAIPEELQRYLLGETGDTIMPCVINEAALPLGVPAPKPGTTLTVMVPMMGENGRYDFARLQPFNLTVVGSVSVPVAAYTVEEKTQRPFYWVGGFISLPLSRWQSIAQQVGAPLEPTELSQVGLVLKDTLNATQVANALRRDLPEYTVLTAPEIRGMVMRATSQTGLPIDMDNLFHLLTVLITGLIVAANAFLMMMQRRREIAVMKSLGASHLNILTMILTELGTLALFSTTIGFSLFRLLIYNPALARSGIDPATIWLWTLQMGATVVGILTGATLLFGLIPAGKAARTPVMEVLRDA